MIQIPKHTALNIFLALTITLVVLSIPVGGQAQGVEPTPTPEVTPSNGPTPVPDLLQKETIQQLQSSSSPSSQTNRGFDPDTLTATYHDSQNLYFPIVTEPWKQPIDFYLSCYGESYPFESCKLIKDISNGSDWSVRWTGKLIVPESGDYVLSLPEHDDGVRVFIDNIIAIDSGWNWPGLDFKGPEPQTVTLSAGQHDIIVDYEQRQEYIAAVQLRWSGPGFADEVIPIYSPTQAPLYSTSLYWQAHDPESKALDNKRLYAFGCSEAKKRNGSVVVVLFFGDPIVYGGEYYTRLPSSTAWIKLDNIAAGVKEYISGYWDCSDGAPLGREHLVLAVGLTSAGEALNTNGHPREHGEEWGKMINRLSEWVLNVPVYNNSSVNYSSRISVVGAINIEKWGGYATPQGAREWVDGYASTTTLPYFCVESCEDCGFASSDPSVWDRDHYWYLAWGAPNALPLPMIYNQTLAQRWQELSMYGATCQDCYPETTPFHSRMYFVGSFTQQQACEDTTNSCTGEDLSPEEGWQALYTALYSDPVTRLEILNWSTDIGWEVYLEPSQ